jgi:hypothetical protein
MTHTTHPTQAPEAEKIAEPPKRWRNWYVALKPWLNIDTGHVLAAGEVWEGTRLLASKDIAETVAASWLSKNMDPGDVPRAEYNKHVCALAEGTRP